MFTRMHESIGWDYIMEGEHKIGLAHGGETVTLEPGGQTELSGAPRRDLHAVAAETRAHLAAVRAAGDAAGIDFMAIGLDPRWAFADIPKMPKTRYRFMREYMPRVGTLGHDMMFRSCTVQVNLDFDSEADMVAKFRVSLALQNVAGALFANSPFRDGKPTGFKSWRLHVWTDVDNDRCGRLPWVFDEGFGFRAYVDWVLDVPMYFLYRDGQYHDVAGQTFRDFFEGRLAGFPGLRPTLDDWELHLTTVFPDVRLKRFLEMRGADGGDWRFILALPALWVGLLYDAQALQECLALTRDWTQKELDHLQRDVPRLALQTTFREGTVQDVAKKVLAIARGGLERRGLGEERYLDVLDAVAGELREEIVFARVSFAGNIRKRIHRHQSFPPSLPSPKTHRRERRDAGRRAAAPVRDGVGPLDRAAVHTRVHGGPGAVGRQAERVTQGATSPPTHPPPPAASGTPENFSNLRNVITYVRLVRIRFFRGRALRVFRPSTPR